MLNKLSILITCSSGGVRTQQILLICVIFALVGCYSKGTQSPDQTTRQSEHAGSKTDHSTSAGQPPVAEPTEPNRVDPDTVQDLNREPAPGSSEQVANPPSSDNAPPENMPGSGNSQPDAQSAANKAEDEESPLADIPLPEQEAELPGEYVEKHTIELPKNWTRVSKDRELWIDVKNKTVIAGGYICLRRGGLEMFICPRNTKEHESVIAVNALSSEIHRSFLALGAAPGSPVQWHPDYKPATGPKVEIQVWWKEDDKIVKRNGKQMVRHFETKQPLNIDWVFGGSRIYKDPEDGFETYYADGGELVCLSNFSTAAMDLPINSSDSNENLLYEAFTENIPVPGTKVYVLFKPEISTTKPDSPKQETGSGETPQKKADPAASEKLGSGDAPRQF